MHLLRCLCAPLSLRSVVSAGSLLMIWQIAVLITLPPPAFAQGPSSYYTGPVYTGGTSTAVYPSGSQYSTHYGPLFGPYAYGSGNMTATTATAVPNGGTATTATVTLTGAVTATFTWQGTDPAPQSAIVTETDQCQAGSTVLPGNGSVSGPCDDGFGQSQTLGPGNSSITETGTRYEIKGGSAPSASWTPNVRLTANSGTSGGANVYGTVSCTAAISPVTISIGGTNNPAQSDYHVLTGQQITATLQGIPSGFTVTSYTWNQPSATCFKTYNEKAASNQLVPLGSADLSGPAAGSTTVTAPDGTSLSVTATSPQINVLKPTVTNWGIAQGYVQYDPSYNSEQYGAIQTYGLYGNLSGTDTSTNGMIWSNVTVSVPPPFSGNGQCTFTQLINPDHLGYNGNSSTTLVTNNGILGLDGSFEYGSPWNVTAAGSDVDSPSVPVGPAGGPQQNSPGYTQLSVSDAFTTYVMYQPSGGVWVPLEKFSWTWSMTLNWQPSQWNLTASYPATAGQAGTPTPAIANDPPQWTVVH